MGGPRSRKWREDSTASSRTWSFTWILEGTHGETGNFIKLGGWEEWRLSDSLLVTESRGRFDAVEYDRQIAEGL